MSDLVETYRETSKQLSRKNARLTGALSCWIDAYNAGALGSHPDLEALISESRSALAFSIGPADAAQDSAEALKET